MQRAPTRISSPPLATMSAREARRLDATLRQAQVPGMRAAAKIESAAFATHVALSHAGMLSASEANMLTMAPLGEARYRAIVDSFAGYAVREISLLAFR